MTVLVFEPEHEGHQPAFVRMLAQWVAARQGMPAVAFAVSGALLARLRSEDSFDLQRQQGCSVVELDETQASGCVSGSLARRSFHRMRLLAGLVERTRASHAVSLFLDPLQLALAVGRRLPDGATLSGVLFRPSVHDTYTAAVPRTLAERLRDRRKLALYGLMLRNPTLGRVLSLDPYFPPFAARHLARGDKVRALPDPVVETAAAAAESAVGMDLQDAVRGDKPVFALFGALSERKGALKLLEALACLPATARGEMRVVLAGRLDPAIASGVTERAQALAASDGMQHCLSIVDRYLTTPELAWLVHRSSVILAPYQRFVGSSGVLTWAADARKPVIAQSYGLVGALVRDYRLGLAVDTSDPVQIGAALLQLAQRDRLESSSRAARWAAFLDGRRAEDFASAVLADLPPRAGGPQ